MKVEDDVVRNDDCTRLWNAVLAQAVRDARNNISKSNARHQSRVSVHYLTSSSSDLAFVCSMAGINLEYALEHFRAYFDEKQHN